MAALANTASAAAPAAAPAPGPAPGSGLGNDPNGPEDLVRVFVVMTWMFVVITQVAAISRAGSWSCAGSGEAIVAPVAIAALVGAAGWAQGSAWGVAQGTLRIPLHVQVIGVFVGFAAAAMFASTHLHLGEAWTPTVAPTPGAALVTTGPYSVVRHPLYASVALMAAFALLSRGWLLLAAAFAAIFAYTALVRVPAEEAAQARAHGEAWRAYAKRVPGALWPAWLSPFAHAPPQPPSQKDRGGLEDEPLLRVS